MPPAMKWKISLDFAMTVLMVLAMAVHVTGVLVHELLGIALFFLFFLHNYLNRRWYSSVLRENRSITQLVSKVINLSLCGVMLILFASGILISQHVFSFLALEGSIGARQIHVAAAYWGYILVSIHLGMHWLMIVSMLRKTMPVSKGRLLSNLLLYFVPVLIFAYGIKVSFDKEVVTQLFSPAAFSFSDPEQAGPYVLLDYLAIMGMYVFITYYLLKFIKKPYKEN